MNTVKAGDADLMFQAGKETSILRSQEIQKISLAILFFLIKIDYVKRTSNSVTDFSLGKNK